MQRSISVSALVLAGALAMPAISMAQTSPSADDRNQSMITDNDREDGSGKWGWLGLLGLAGLLGLKRHDREKDIDRIRTRQPA